MISPFSSISFKLSSERGSRSGSADEESGLGMGDANIGVIDLAIVGADAVDVVVVAAVVVVAVVIVVEAVVGVVVEAVVEAVVGAVVEAVITVGAPEGTPRGRVSLWLSVALTNSPLSSISPISASAVSCGVSTCSPLLVS